MADWASVAQSAVGPIVGSGITVWATRNSDRERLSAAIIWMDGFDHREEYVNWPALHVHNRSKQAIMIATMETRLGVFVRRRAMDYFPMEYDDPTDLQFPYRVEAGEVKQFCLDPAVLDRAAATAGRLDRALGYVRIPYLRVGVRTMAGGRVFVDAADATSCRDRPKWLER